MIKENRKEFALFIVFILTFLLMSVLSPDKFLGVANLRSMAFQIPEFGILAFAMMVVVLTGGINLSLTYNASLAGVVMALVLRSMNENGYGLIPSLILAIIVALIVALVCGLVNSVLVAVFGVTPILATLGTMIFFRGIGQNLTKGYSISGFPAGFEFIGNGVVFGIPFSFILLIVIAIFVWVLLEKKPWGLQLHMLGNSETAVEYSGVNTKKVLFKAYAFSAFLCFFAALVMTSRYNSMKPEYGYSYLLQSILAVVLGGTSINGGYGKVAGTIIAIGIIQVISSGLNIAGVNQFMINTIMGTMLILVLAMNFITTQLHDRKSLVAKMKS